jgi:hypothetical protein
MHLSLGFQETERVVYIRKNLPALQQTKKNDVK